MQELNTSLPSLPPSLPPPPSPHQESKLYYDAEQGTYLYYNTDTKKYEIHSSVRLPPARKKTGMERGPDDDVIDLCSDDEDQNKGKCNILGQYL